MAHVLEYLQILSAVRVDDARSVIVARRHNVASIRTKRAVIHGTGMG